MIKPPLEGTPERTYSDPTRKFASICSPVLDIDAGVGEGWLVIGTQSDSGFAVFLLRPFPDSLLEDIVPSGVKQLTSFPENVYIRRIVTSNTPAMLLAGVQLSHSGGLQARLSRLRPSA